MPCSAMAQSDRQYIREGNKLYRNGKFVKAESAYRKALTKNSNNAIATYNLGCAQMRQDNDSAAIETFLKASSMTNDKTIRAKSSHNIGVKLQQKRKYKEAIEAYKEALRNDPKDDDSRYNLILCKKLLKQQQQQQQQQKQDKKDDKKDNNQDKKDQQQQKDENKDENKDKDKNKENNENKNKEQQRQMSRENAEQLLNAAMQQEKETQQKLKKAMQQPSRRKLDKNW